LTIKPSPAFTVGIRVVFHSFDFIAHGSKEFPPVLLTLKSLFFEEEKLNAKASFLPQRHRGTEAQRTERSMRYGFDAGAYVPLAASVTEKN